MAKHSDADDWEARKERVIGLGERSFHKSYYPQLRANLDRLERFRTLLDRTTDCVVLITLPKAIVADSNAAFGELLGEPVEALIGRPYASLGLGKIEDILGDVSPECQADSDTPVSTPVAVELVRNGQCRWLELTCRTAMLDGRCYGVMVGRDITDRKRAHEIATALLAEKEALLDNALVGIAMVRNRQIVSCNRRLETLFGYPPGGMAGQSARILYGTEEGFIVCGEDAYRCLEHGQAFINTTEMVRADGSRFWCELSGRAIDPEEAHRGSIWILTDVTERKQAEERAQFLAYHDVLTGLPNQSLLQDRLKQAMAFSKRDGTKLALVVADLDRFKTVNDVIGYQAGDRLLVGVCNRMMQRLRTTDTLSRKGGDEFVLLLTDLTEPDAAVTFLGELMRTVHEPFSIDGQELNVTFSAGIAIYPDDGTDFESLLKKADMAMYRAKNDGRNTYRFFNEAMNVEAAEQMSMLTGLWRALEADQFVLHYQPQIDLNSGELIGAEALLRWQHPELGLVSPLRFIPVAEETGLIVPIGEWVLQQACREAARWRQAGMRHPVVAVNLSAVQFKRGEIEQTVAEALRLSGIDADMLELEITESVLIRDTDNVLTTTQRLKSMGVKLAIDDFGTGYSSLSYLRRFKVDKLKIDQSFIRDLLNNDEDAAIVRAIIQMANSLGVRTLAEGVETRAELDRLHAYCCDEAQGFFYSRPMPADEFKRFLDSSLNGRQQTHDAR